MGPLNYKLMSHIGVFARLSLSETRAFLVELSLWDFSWASAPQLSCYGSPAVKDKR